MADKQWFKVVEKENQTNRYEVEFIINPRGTEEYFTDMMASHLNNAMNEFVFNFVKTAQDTEYVKEKTE